MYVLKKNIIIKIIFLLFTNPVLPSDLVEILPLTSSIIILHFNDGYVIHHQNGQKRTDEKVFSNPLDVIKAMNKISYFLQSNDDGNYKLAINPIEIGRKSKGTAFAWICEKYDNGCLNKSIDHTNEHWVYLMLPFPLQSGMAYNITLDNLATGNNSIQLLYDEKHLRSEAIHVNNLGYTPNNPSKFAYLSYWMGDKGNLNMDSFNEKKFDIIDTFSKNIVFTGKIIFRKGRFNKETLVKNNTPNENFSSSDVYECDFSNFNIPGEYIISIKDMGCSFPFSINEDVYNRPFYWTMKALYQNRSGIELKEPFTDFPRKAPHNPQLTPGFKGKLKYSTTRCFDLTNFDASQIDKPAIEKGLKGDLNSYGWYQDAGDWDAYYTHSHVPALLMFLYEADPKKFTDNQLNIPESGNGIPDILDEALWLLHFYKRVKDEIIEKKWGTGGIPGARIFGDLWGSETRNDGTTFGSWQDTTRTWYILGEDPWMTYKYAALTAQMAYLLKNSGLKDPNNVDWKTESEKAYKWALNNTKKTDDEIRFVDFKDFSYKNIPQEYKHFDTDLRAIRLYAGASLYRLTNNSFYHQKFINEIGPYLKSNYNPQNNDALFSYWMYPLISFNRKVNKSAFLKVQTENTLLATSTVSKSTEIRSFRWGGSFKQPMIFGQASTPMILSGVYAVLNYKYSNSDKARSYLKNIFSTADYFLGANPLNMTWISGLGERYPKGIFHLDWWYGNNKNIIKGIIPYGPSFSRDLGTPGPWNPKWAFKTLYPTEVDKWPGHELWFDQRSSHITCEFTIHENIAVGAFVYGFLMINSK